MKKYIISSVLAFFLICQVVYAQGGIYNHGAKIVSGSGSYIVATGDYQAETNAANQPSIDLDGLFYIAGDFVNNSTSGGAFSNIDSDGYLVFNGTGTQNIAGSSLAMLQLENLQVNTGTNVHTNGFEVQVDGETNLNSAENLITLGTQDFNLNGTVAGNGWISAPSTGKVVRNTTINIASTFPVGDATSDFSVTITPTSNPTNPIQVQIITTATAPPGSGMISTDLHDITGDTGLDATIVFTIPDTSLEGGTLPENVIFRYWNGSRYVGISTENITIVDNGTYYEVTVTNVNEF